MVSGSALQLETCYAVVALPYPFFAKTSLFPPKLAASSVAAGSCSNSPLTLTCGSPPSHYQQVSPVVASPSPPAKFSATYPEVLQLHSSLPRNALVPIQARFD